MKDENLTAILTIAPVSALVGAGTLAYSSGTETSTGNTFTAGTMDLKLIDLDESEDGVVATWTLSDMKPRDGLLGWVILDAVGSVEADHVEITCDYSVTEESPQVADTDPNTNQHPDEMTKQLVIDQAYYSSDGYDINLLTGDNILTPENEGRADWRIDDVNDDGKITLYDLKNDPLDNLLKYLPATCTSRQER